MKKRKHHAGGTVPARGPEPVANPSRNSPLIPAAAVLLSGALIRFIWLWQVRADIFMHNLIIDAAFYDEWAKTIAHGNFLGHGAFYQDPSYAYFLAACYWIFGHDLNIIRIIQAILDVGTLGLIYFIGSKLFSARAGLLAVAMGALYGPMVYYTALLDKSSLALFLTALSQASLILATSSQRRVHFIASGAIFGLAILTRGNMLIAAFGTFLWLLFSRQPGTSTRTSLLRSLWFAGGVVGVIGLVTARNYWASGDLVPITSNTGLNFYIGNNGVTAGNYLEPPFLRGVPDAEYADSKSAAERLSGRTMRRPSEVSRFWLHQGLSFIFHEPGIWAKLLARKSFLLCSGFEIPETYSYYYFREKYSSLSIPALTFGVLAPIGILGAILFWSRRRFSEPHILLIAYPVSLLFFWNSSEYRTRPSRK